MNQNLISYQLAEFQQKVAREKMQDIFDNAPGLENVEVERTYLYDWIPKTETMRGVRRFTQLLSDLNDRIIQELGDTLLTCIRIGSTEVIEGISSERREFFNEFGIIPEDSVFFTEYSENNEMYYGYFVINCEKSDILSRIWISIANGTTGIEPAFPGDVFFFNPYKSTVLHIYDDRGFDIIRY